MNKFAIGMGPRIFGFTRGETEYSLRVFPVGGFVSLEGEDIFEENSDPRSFSNKSLPKKFIVLAAGSFMNFVLGFVILLILFSPIKKYSTPVIDHFADELQQTGLLGLEAGDRILAVNGERILVTGDVSLFLGRYEGPYDVKIKRDGETILLENLPLKTGDYNMDGEPFRGYGLVFKTVTASPLTTVSYAFNSAWNLIRFVRLSLFDLIGGKASVSQLSGPVGITAAIGEASRVSFSASWYFVALITLNLAFMNLMPIPALDGGRIFFIIVSGLVKRIRGRGISIKLEAAVNSVGLILVLIFMVYVTYNDIVKLVKG